MLHTFKPSWWLRNRHVQTCLAALIPRIQQPTRFEHIIVADGDLLELHWLDVEQAEAPTLLLLHGMEGSLHSAYIQGMLQVCKQLHWRAVVLHLRGCQGRINALPQCYHAGKTDDLELTLKHIKSSYPQSATIFALGYSLGANQLLKFLGENPQQKLIAAALAISIPFSLEACTRYIHQGLNRVYEIRFLKSLTRMVARKLELNMDMPISREKLSSIKTLYDFDDQITAPLHGFKGAQDYYTRSSCGQFLPHIQTPTLIIHAADDPFIPSTVIPQPSQVSSWVRLSIQKYGGHVGFINLALGRKPYYWLEEVVPQFFQTLPSNSIQC